MAFRSEARHGNQPSDIIRASYHCIAVTFTSAFIQLYTSYKMERFSYKGGYGVRGRIEVLERKAGLGYR